MLERAVSGRFSPLPAPFPLRDLPLRAPRSALRAPRSAPTPIIFCHARFTLRSAPPDSRPAPLTLRSRSAHMLCSILLRGELQQLNVKAGL